MAAAAWGSAFLYALLHTANTFSVLLCKGNAVDQFFCEILQILKLSCSHSYLREVGLLGVSLSLAFGCFVFIVLSCVQIFRAMLRKVESLWIRIKGQAHKGDITVGVYYRPPDQEEEVDEAFYRQLQAASQSARTAGVFLFARKIIKT